jgi:mercuric ion transport protein
MRAWWDGAGVLGLGVAACAVCCAGPLLGVLGAVGLGAVLAVVAGSLVGIGVLALVAVPLVARRRGRRPAGPVPVSLGRSGA